MTIRIGALLSLLGAIFGRGEAVRPAVSTEDDRRELRRYARDTWRSFEAMVLPDGLPADRLVLGADGSTRPTGTTSPTDIASYLWSLLAAERLGLVGPAEVDGRLDRALTALAKLRRDHGFFFNAYDLTSREPSVRTSGYLPGTRPFLSTVDNAWLAVALMMLGPARPALRDRAGALLGPMDFGFFHEPFDPADPIKRPGQLRAGFFPDDRTFQGPYGMLNTEPRIASYVAIARGQAPPEHYDRLYRTLPAGAGRQHQAPRGESRDHRGVPVFEGHYDYRGISIVPSWGGSQFEALMVPLFVPEERWAPRSWGVNHPLYARAQIEQGLTVQNYGVWGFSPSLDPAGGYRTYGVDDLGADPDGYRTFDPPKPGAKPKARDGVVTPHASFLALRFAPREAMDNLRTLATRYPTIYGPYGFRDSVDVATGAVADGVLALDQGMILAAIANALGDDAIRHLFSDGPIEAAIRPLMADEVFSAAPRPAGQRP